MTSSARRCIAMSVGAGALIVALVAAGVPGALLLVLVPTLACVAMTSLMGRGDPDGQHLLETAQQAVRPPQE